MNFKTLLLGAAVVLSSLLAAPQAQAQQSDPNVSVKVALAPGARAGESSQIIATFKVKEGMHLYAPSKPADFVEVGLAAPEGETKYKANGTLVEPPLPVKNIPGFNVPGALVYGEASFALPIQISATAPAEGKAKVEVSYQACTDASCDMPQTVVMEIPWKLEPGEPRSDRLAAVTTVPDQPAGYQPPKEGETGAKDDGKTAEPTDATRTQINQARQQGILPFMLLAFLLGLGALATPCVWPMIPITVSFFSKKAEDGKSSLPGALAYAGGIMVTFTGIGIGVSLLFGATGVQQLAANPWLNLALAALFIALALNLFGVYEIMVPAKWVNSLNKKGGKAGGLLGPVLMGLAFSLTSFTCTVPFAGTVLASAATGDVFYPALGMLAFSFAFALPFFLLAMFPQYLTKLPKSGSWLVSVKAYMGFLELAFAFKFLSNVDLVFGWGLLTREAFLAVWAAVLTVASVYLMGWLKLAKEGDVKIGWGRFAFGLVNFGIVAYLIGAIQGAPMGQVTAFLPPDPYPGRASKSTDLAWYDHVDKAVAEAREKDRLVFVDFTGVTCANCRVMEMEFFPQPAIRSELEKFSRAKLFTDRPTPADTFNAQLRDKLTKTATNPVYVIMTPDQKVLRIYQGLAPNSEDFIKFLRGTSGTVAAKAP